MEEKKKQIFCPGLQVRLKETVYGRSRRYLGGVQVNRYGFWGPVCNSSWDDRDANATCHGLGYSYGITYFGRDSTGELCFPFLICLKNISLCSDQCWANRPARWLARWHYTKTKEHDQIDHEYTTVGEGGGGYIFKGDN